RLQAGLTGKLDDIAQAVGKRRDIVEEILAGLVREGLAAESQQRTGKPGRPACVYGAANFRPEAQSGAHGRDGFSAPERAADPELLGQKGKSVPPSSPREEDRDGIPGRRVRVTL